LEVSPILTAVSRAPLHPTKLDRPAIITPAHIALKIRRVIGCTLLAKKGRTGIMEYRQTKADFIALK